MRPAPITSPSTSLPLAGIRVLELARFQAGPRCGLILGDLGAEVIKVERPGGEPTRRSVPLVEGESVYFAAYNRGKRSLCLDFRTEEGRRVLRDLVAASDVVLENFRPGTMEKLGLGYDELVKLRPDVILVSVSGFGREGRLRGRPAFDGIVQALSGLMSLTGRRLAQPVGTASSIVDRSAALLATIGALAALRHRDRTGEGQVVDVSLMDAALGMVEVPLAYYLTTGAEGGENGRLPYEAADGWVVINAVSAAHRAALLGAIGAGADEDDGALWTSASERQPAFLDTLRGWCRAHTVAEICAALERADVPVGACRTIPQVADDPYVRERELLVEIASGPVRMYGPGPSVRLSRTPSRVGDAPAVGADSQAVLLETLGYDAARVQELVSSGVVGCAG